MVIGKSSRYTPVILTGDVLWDARVGIHFSKAKGGTMKFRPRWVRHLPILVGYAVLAALYARREVAATLCYVLVLIGYILEVWWKPHERE